MSHIKLEYSLPYCTNGRNKQLHLDYDYFSCDGCSECDIDAYTRPAVDEKYQNPPCAFLKYKRGIIEGHYKRFKYEEGSGLVLGNKTYYAEEIEHLEIDGKIYIEGGLQC